MTPPIKHLAGDVTHRVDVDLDGVLEEAVDEHRTLRGQPAFTGQAAEAGELGHRAGQLVDVVDDLHRPAAEHVAGAHEHREPDLLDDGQRFLQVSGHTARRLRDAQLVAHGVPLLAVLGEIDRGRRRAGDQCLRQQRGQLERRLTAEGDDDLRWRAACGCCLGGDHVEDVLGGERFEVQAVGRVVVGRHRLRVAVDHHGLEAGVAQGEAGMDAAVVELDALADAVRPGAEDHHPRPIGGRTSLSSSHVE